MAVFTSSEACKTICEEIKQGKHRYAIFSIKSEQLIFVDKVGERNADYDQFLQDLKSDGVNGCRYALYDMEYTLLDVATSTTRRKLILMTWIPDTAKIKLKMLYASAFIIIKTQLTGMIDKYIQATDDTEVSKEFILGQLRAMG